MSQLPKKTNKWLPLINIPVQMGVIIFLFAYLGQWLDTKYTNKGNNYNKIFILAGVFLALYNTIRQVNAMNKNNE